LKRQFTLRQLRIVSFVIGATLAWFSWRELWEAGKIIRALNAREKVREDGTVVWELYMVSTTVYLDDRGRDIPPPAISKGEMGSVLLIVFVASSAVWILCPLPSVGLAKETVMVGCALPVIIFLIEAFFFIGNAIFHPVI
jgi:hypothetical protein